MLGRIFYVPVFKKKSSVIVSQVLAATFQIELSAAVEWKLFQKFIHFNKVVQCNK